MSSNPKATECDREAEVPRELTLLDDAVKGICDHVQQLIQKLDTVVRSDHPAPGDTSAKEPEQTTCVGERLAASSRRLLGANAELCSVIGRLEL